MAASYATNDRIVDDRPLYDLIWQLYDPYHDHGTSSRQPLYDWFGQLHEPVVQQERSDVLEVLYVVPSDVVEEETCRADVGGEPGGVEGGSYGSWGVEERGLILGARNLGYDADDEGGDEEFINWMSAIQYATGFVPIRSFEVDAPRQLQGYRIARGAFDAGRSQDSALSTLAALFPWLWREFNELASPAVRHASAA